ncbi:hypothetical protein [Embleya sp. NBC_00896]|uniref:hypothetical protein n=1 Tax=Embleya sp. NBC_00896 TaxID=2975961 RepID=UPI003870C1EA|nr:hypothetical protein OG928_32510 [Embleya sp. NBC_00896]
MSPDDPFVRNPARATATEDVVELMDQALQRAGQRSTALELLSVPADDLRPVALGRVHFARVNPDVEIGGFSCDLPTGANMLAEVRGNKVVLDSRFFTARGEKHGRTGDALALVQAEGEGPDVVKFGIVGVTLHELEHVRHHQIARQHGRGMPDILRANAMSSEAERDAAAFPPRGQAPAVPWTVRSLYQAQPELRLITPEIVEPVMGKSAAHDTVEFTAIGGQRVHQLGNHTDRLSVVVTTAIVGKEQTAAIQDAAPGLTAAAIQLRKSTTVSRDVSNRAHRVDQGISAGPGTLLVSGRGYSGVGTAPTGPERSRAGERATAGGRRPRKPDDTRRRRPSTCSLIHSAAASTRRLATAFA